jgi:subtilisin family serine protease
VDPSTARRRLATMIAALALLTAGSTVPATAKGKSDVRLAGAAQVRLPAGAVHQVTLVTGDVVTLRRLQGGKPGVTVQPAPRPGGRRASFNTVTAKGDLYVVPADVAALVPAVLDRELFNVTGLVRQGYDDRRSSTLPLIIRHDPKDKQVGGGLGALAGGGATVKRRLATLAAVAVDQPKARADRLLPALREASQVAAGARTARAAAGEASARLGGVTQVLLDRKLRVAALDRNLVQVNAQPAWDAGLSGQSVKVAVLDTGVDADHPDLAGQVLAAENFTDDPDTGDHAGHGTHVAGIAGGTGAAAGGDRRGVGFGAKLLNGKVCNQFGDCFMSSIAAGMEWAATQGAKVVNLSLGGAHTDGLDPVEETLEHLTATAGMLFVAAAGNDGPTDPDRPEAATLGSPAEAPSALAVGAVDPDDGLAGFSSTGPSQGDVALKPEITAPGVGIIAPRAQGTEPGEPVGDDYVKLSGTSMAAPHVAGAAAALLERFPTMSPAQLKATLVGAASPNPALGVYQQGGGRLDLGRAVAQTITAQTPTVDFGLVGYPHRDRTFERTVAFRNHGPAQTTVNLAATLAGPDGQPAPPGTLTLSARSLTIPPGGAASVTATVTEPQATGLYSGRLTATAADTVIGVPVGLYNEHARANLTIRALDGTGAPANAEVGVYKIDQDPLELLVPLIGERTIRVPPGTYHLYTIVGLDEAGGFEHGFALVIQPEVTVTGDTTVTLDGRRAVRLQPSVEGSRTTCHDAVIEHRRTFAPGTSPNAVISSFFAGCDAPLAIAPTRRVTVGAFTAVTRWTLQADAPTSGTGTGTVPVGGDIFELLFDHPGRVPNVIDYRLSRDDVQRRMARVRTSVVADPPASVGQDDPPTFYLGWYAAHPDTGLTSMSPLVISAPTRRDHYVLADGRTTWQQAAGKFFQGFFQSLELTSPATDLQGGQRLHNTFFEQPLHPTIVTGPNQLLDRPLGPVTRSRDQLILDIPTAVDAAGNFEDDQAERPDRPLTIRSRLYRDDVLVEEHQDTSTPFPLTADPATYRLKVDVDNPGLTLATATRTRWTFRSAAPKAGTQPVPLLLVDYDLPLDAHNQRPASAPLVVPFKVARQPTAPPAAITSANVRFSVDDGHTWHPTVVTPRPGGGFLALPTPTGPLPQPGDLVSLKVRATDAGGSIIEETIQRAWAVAPLTTAAGDRSPAPRTNPTTPPPARAAHPRQRHAPNDTAHIPPP